MSISKSTWMEWKREFPFLNCTTIAPEANYSIDRVEVKRMDAELLATKLSASIYESVSFGDKRDWVRGWFIFENSLVELETREYGSSASGDHWEKDCPTVGEQLADAVMMEPYANDVKKLEAVVVVSHDDGDYNGGLPSTTLTVYKVPRKGTEVLLQEYWATVKAAIHKEVEQADIVG